MKAGRRQVVLEGLEGQAVVAGREPQLLRLDELRRFGCRAAILGRRDAAVSMVTRPTRFATSV